MKKIVTQTDIEGFESLYRRHFCNGLTGYKSPVLVGTVSPEGVENAAIFSNVFHVGASPAMIGMIARPTSIPRDTISNIKATEFYTLNHIPLELYEKAHLTSGKYPAEVSEFEALDLESERIGMFAAPFLEASPLKIGLSLSSMTFIPENDTWFIIGRVEFVEVEEEKILETGHVDFSELHTVASTGLDTYYKTELVDRLKYAKLPKSE